MDGIPTLDLANPQEARLSTRILNLAANPPDTEYSYYGPIDSLLNLYFPFDGYWMIKPQAPIRDLVAGHSSVDSMGRNVDSSGRHAKRADFLVTRFSGTGRQDVINLVIEIKPGSTPPDMTSVRVAVAQLSGYMTMLNRGLLPERGGQGAMRGLLIVGITCFSYQITEDGVPEQSNDLPEEGASLLSPAFREFLVQRRDNIELAAPIT